MGSIVLMGRKTWVSLPGSLPGRRNWVLSRSAGQEEGMTVFRSLEEVDRALVSKDKLFVIGGGEVYSLALPRCDELFVTEVPRFVADGDAFFPDFRDEFSVVETLDENEDFVLRRWIRKPAA